jgi:hypothetical protein
MVRAFACSAVVAVSAAFMQVSPGLSAPVFPRVLVKEASVVEQVRLRRPFPHRGFYGPRFYRMGAYRAFRPPWRGYGPGWAVGPFVAGAIVGGALAAPYFGPYRPYGYYRHSDWPCNSWRQDCQK